jgi:predicted molibdopterin-dependent oxidoreductase YjgC
MICVAAWAPQGCSSIRVLRLVSCCRGRKRDATGHSLTDGDRVELSNRHGALHASIRLTDTILAGVVALPGKWWSVPAETGALRIC